MRCWVLPGSVQLQDYYIRPEKMGAPRKDLADAILSYNGNDSQKNGELFSSRYRKKIPQTRADMQKHLYLPILHSPIGRESIKTGTKADSPDGLYCSGGRTLPPYAQLMGNS